MIAIYATEEIREFERIAKEQYILNGDELMARAGKAAFELIQHRFKGKNNIAVFCGAGNNGGDGYVVAQLLHAINAKVIVYQVGNHAKLKKEARNAYQACKDAKVPMQEFKNNIDLSAIELIVDALCGIGMKGNLHGDMAVAAEKINNTNIPIFAIDIPSGVDADTGVVKGIAINATMTMTFIGLKFGLLTGAGVAYTGELLLNNLALPEELFKEINFIAEKISFNDFTHYLKPRSKDWHKGMSGHVLIVGGEVGFSGAPRMAAEAALRVGAGLVTVATRVENAIEMNATCPEIMCHGIEDEKQLSPLLDKADVIVLGPGLGQSQWAKKLWKIVTATKVPLVVDADALNILSASKGQKNDNWVLTPHPGEASRLLKMKTAEIQANRLQAVIKLHKQYHGVSVLKGAGSLILGQQGKPALCDKGNPGMASAGMGDVLSGVIGGLIAQGIPIDIAAKLGVCMHAEAGDMAAKEGERGTIATDLMQHLRYLANIQND